VDPAPGYAPAERDRVPFLEIAGHSHYLAEWRLKQHADGLG
jgi:hypothetical protein